MFSSARALVARVALPALGSILLVSVAAAASGTFSLFGDATVQPGTPGSVKLTSDSSPGYGGIDYQPAGTLKFEDLHVLSTTFQTEADDDCNAGSPRFQVNIDNKNLFVYIGQAPNWNC